MADEFKKLFIVIGARTDGFSKGLKDVEKGLNKFKGVANLALVAGTAIAAGVGSSVKQYADLGGEFDDMRRRTGLNAKTLSQWKYAADQSGASLAGLETGIKKMQKSIYDAGRGLSTANDAFETLGIKIEDIKDLSPDEQFEKIMEAVASIEDPAIRTGVAMDILGRSGTDLLPIFANGIEGLKTFKEEAQRAGVVFTNEGAAKADQFGDSIGRLQTLLNGVAIVVADSLVPALQPLIDKLIVVIENISNWISKNPQLTQGIAALGVVLIGAGGLFYAIKAIVSVLQTMAVAMSLVQALSGPKGWIMLGVGLAAVAGATIGINEMLKTPETPKGYASGGVAWTPQVASLAENEPEAIIPLSKLGGGEIHIHVDLDGEQIAEVVDRRMYNWVNPYGAKGYV
jgi:hypothetical protein